MQASTSVGGGTSSRRRSVGTRRRTMQQRPSFHLEKERRAVRGSRQSAADQFCSFGTGLSKVLRNSTVPAKSMGSPMCWPRESSVAKETLVNLGDEERREQARAATTSWVTCKDARLPLTLFLVESSDPLYPA